MVRRCSRVSLHTGGTPSPCTLPFQHFRPCDPHAPLFSLGFSDPPRSTPTFHGHPTPLAPPPRSPHPTPHEELGNRAWKATEDHIGNSAAPPPSPPHARVVETVA